MLEKKVIKFLPVDNVKIRFETDDVFIIPYISLSDKMLLIPEYIETLNDISSQNSAGSRYLIAEYSLMTGIIDMLTSIDIENNDIELVFISGLWDSIKSKICNYEEFRDELNKAVQASRFEETLEKSVGKVLDQASAKIIELLNNIANSDLKSEQIKEISDNLINHLEGLNNTAPGIISGSAVKRGRKPKSKTV